MSFILDALKKSEIERQRQSVPGLVDSGIARPRPRLPMWAIALGALLAVNLLVLTVVLVRGWLTAPNVPQSAGTAAPQRQITADATDHHFSPLDAAPGAAPVYAPEIPVVTTPAAPTLIPKASNPGSSGPHAVRRQDPLLTDNDYKPEDEETLPTISEISLTGSQALPELHLDVHVFATKPAERFVYINMRKYHEGSTLEEGPTIERIRRNGVILNYHALRFLLPRQ